MNPKEIPENLDLAQNLLGQWLRYRQFYYKGISKETITPQEEMEFLEISSSIAQNVRKLVQRMDESQFPFRSADITAQLKTAISVGHFRNLPVADQKTFYKDWHVSVIYLSRTVGALKFLNEGYRPAVVAKAAAGVKKGTGGPGAPQGGMGMKGGAPMKGGAAPKGGKKSSGGGGGAMKKVIIVIVLVGAAIGGYVLVKMFL